MTDNVVSLKGETVLAPYEPNGDAVAAVERLLEQVRTGEVQSVVLVMVHGDDSYSHQTVGRYRPGLIGETMLAVHELCAGI